MPPSTTRPPGVPLAVWPKLNKRQLRQRIFDEFSTRQDCPDTAIIDIRGKEPDPNALTARLTAAAKKLGADRHVVVLVDRGTTCLSADPLTQVVTVAHSANLRYIQHIVVLQCTLRDLPGPAKATNLKHIHAHEDLLVFATTEAALV